MEPTFLNRNVNEGFSGGEKKRNEILQLAVLEVRNRSRLWHMSVLRSFSICVVNCKIINVLIFFALRPIQKHRIQSPWPLSC